MTTPRSSDVIQDWPDESREAAQTVIDTYGEAHEATASQLMWHDVGHWKRVIATKAFYHHEFPVPHIDSVETVIKCGDRTHRCEVTAPGTCGRRSPRASAPPDEQEERRPQQEAPPADLA